ncbi:hypothetical protein FOA43_002535 [Brettanomyces nanus]|uniref:Inositol-pentakisphosphate 2-kinase n=1 Tax=Eeniella nana TaxID=13502 RepID=A0A875S492_EENNA|nr:uncharacterized protein FOA43_002535 [Brettanomyces nanus]QPG75185.1 hypothetical protein FOA43_002535 [Brettanomyces nanus]
MDWEFLTKGSANAVYRYCGKDSRLEGKVLRVRLKGNTIRTREVYEYLSSSLFDAIRHYMLQIQLVSLDRQLIKKLEEFSPQGVQLDTGDPEALLMDNVFKGPLSEYKLVKLNKYIVFYVKDEEVLFEFKPKWLYKPPKSFSTCRNCAQAKMKNQSFVNCCLPLINGKEQTEQWFQRIIDEIQRLGLEKEIPLNSCRSGSSLLADLYNVIQALFRLQNKPGFDIHSVLKELKGASDVDNFLLLSMTLKD